MLSNRTLVHPLLSLQALIDGLQGDDQPKTMQLLSDLQHTCQKFTGLIDRMFDWIEATATQLPKMTKPKRAAEKVDGQWLHKQNSTWRLLAQ